MHVPHSYEHKEASSKLQTEFWLVWSRYIKIKYDQSPGACATR